MNLGVASPSQDFSHMLDITLIRQSPDLVKSAALSKGFDVDVDRLLVVDAERRQSVTKASGLRERLNALSALIPTLQPAEREQSVKETKELKREVARVEAELARTETEYEALMLMVPNIPVAGTPIGATDADNVEIDRWGELPTFDFDPKDHTEIGLSLGLFDFERSRKYAGSRSYSLTGDGVMLERAVIQFALDHIVNKKFKAISPPIMVRQSALEGTGFFPLGAAETYALERDDLYLVGTSEVSLVAQHRDEILDEASLPLRYVGVSPCFRREAGAAGRDTRGLYRVHMFTKVEQVSIGPNDSEWSEREHFRLLENSREILRALEIPHRVALACTGELGLGQVRKHEIESWMPSRSAYSETHSCSSLFEFQSRRSRIRYRTEGGLKFAHTLNNTAIASPRIIIPLLENHQLADGTVRIPAALRRYLGGREFLS
jgi:seryl-tRNA synthetase